MTCDQVDALARTLGEPTLTIAPWTSARAILELTALASWLADPGIDAKKRAERSYAVRFEGVSQQKTFVNAAREDAAPAVLAIQNLEAEATAMGLTIFRDNTGRLTGIGDRWMPFTRLTKETLDEEANYRLFSAMTHGHIWAASRLGFHYEASGASSPLAVSADVPMEKVMPPLAAHYLCIITLKNVIGSVGKKAQLFGWDQRRLKEMLAPHLAELATSAPPAS
jgi:hypothetical protein